MAEKSFFWANTTIGDAAYAPVSFSDFAAILQHLTGFSYNQSDNTLGGFGLHVSGKTDPLRHVSGVLTGLDVNYISGSVVRLSAGVAMVGGYLYINSADINFACAIGADERWWFIYLDKDVAAQTIRAACSTVFNSIDGFTEEYSETDEKMLIAIVHSPAVSGAYEIIDVRRMIRSRSYEVPIMFSHQYADRHYGGAGDVDTDTDMDDEFGIFVGSIMPETPYSSVTSGTLQLWRLMLDKVFDRTVVEPMVFIQQIGASHSEPYWFAYYDSAALVLRYFNSSGAAASNETAKFMVCAIGKLKQFIEEIPGVLWA